LLPYRTALAGEERAPHLDQESCLRFGCYRALAAVVISMQWRRDEYVQSAAPGAPAAWGPSGALQMTRKARRRRGGGASQLSCQKTALLVPAILILATFGLCDQRRDRNH
jgi:hypothetical protein